MSSAKIKKDAVIGKRLRNIRESMHKSQEDFAEAISCTKLTVGRIERGETGITKKMLEKLQKHFYISSNYIETGEGEMFSTKQVFFDDLSGIPITLSQSDSLEQRKLFMKEDTALLLFKRYPKNTKVLASPLSWKGEFDVNDLLFIDTSAEKMTMPGFYIKDVNHVLKIYQVTSDDNGHWTYSINSNNGKNIEYESLCQMTCNGKIFGILKLLY
ncbi:MAG TPA: helix-turn-helix transcriptional regulator [bacterium]|nr:helix-turn-helix transcriptional regulator [bacterium]